MMILEKRKRSLLSDFWSFQALFWQRIGALD